MSARGGFLVETALESGLERQEGCPPPALGKGNLGTGDG